MDHWTNCKKNVRLTLLLSNLVHPLIFKYVAVRSAYNFGITTIENILSQNLATSATWVDIQKEAFWRRWSFQWVCRSSSVRKLILSPTRYDDRCSRSPTVFQVPLPVLLTTCVHRYGRLGEVNFWWCYGVTPQQRITMARISFPSRSRVLPFFPIGGTRDGDCCWPEMLKDKAQNRVQLGKCCGLSIELRPSEK